MILLYDTSTTRWSEQMVLGSEIVSTADGPVPMEIDRVEGKAKGKGSKGKPGAKAFNSNPKGKSKGKQKGQNKGAAGGSKGGKGKSEPKGAWSKGDSGNKGKGKSNDQQKTCWNCGRNGHYAKDCWQNHQVRVIPQGFVHSSDGGAVQQTAQGSPSSSAGGSFTQVSSVSQHGQQQQSSQYRVARIVESNVDDLVFNLTACSVGDGSVRVVRFHIGDDEDDSGFVEAPAGVRAVIEELEDEPVLETILLDSGADASVFPVSMLHAGTPTSPKGTMLCDAQGRRIPVEGMRLVEIRVPTSSGRSILLKERVATSSGITQPILCFGHLLEQGFGIDGVEQSLVHRGGEINIPLQMQNKSMTILSKHQVLRNQKRYVQFRLRFNKSSSTAPLDGPQCRTTLVKLDDGSWCILELNEPLRSIIQLDSKFHDMDGMRSVITLVTEGEKPPGLMGFAFEEDGPIAGQIEPQADPGDAALRAPDDDIQGADIEGPIEVDVEGQAVGEAQIVVQPAKDDEIVVDGITLKSGSSLAALRAACSSYGISSSGGKLKCFSRLVNHQKNLELQTITHAAQDALNAQVRVPNAPALPEPPSEAAQDLHRLTHTPYQPWCESCVAHRARADRHAHDFSSKDGSCPTISFDYFYTKAGEQRQDPDALVALILVDSKTGYLGCVPMSSKAQFDLATKEIIAFCQTLGYNKVMLRCDNEPSVVQLQRLTVQARQQMGLETQACTPSAYEHGNALAENAIRSNVHAAWILNRYNPHQGLTAFEVVYGKQYQGQICEYGEPVLGFAKTPLKGNPKWRRMVFLGKVEGQDSFLLYDGTSLILTRSVRRVKTNWVVYMAYYKQFNLFSWQYKVGFGGRVQPTKRRGGPRPASMAPPLTAVEPSKLVDEDAEAVRAKAQEERREETKLEMMSAFDKPQEVQREVQFGDGRIFEEESQELQPVVPGPQPLLEVSTSAKSSNDLSSSSGTVAIQPSIGLEVPMTPQDGPMTTSPTSPRHSSTTRTHADDPAVESEMKRSKVEDAKKQRINRLAAEQEQFIRTVKFGEEVYHTLDSYADEPQMTEKDDVEEDPWLGEEELHFAGVDERLWSDHPLTEQPPDPGDKVDRLADEVEISRLLEMKVLVASSDYTGDVKGRLTTKFVKDWRKKVYVSLDGQSRERWMRRSRLVAREYANTKRDDTFSPATGAHTSNLLPVYFLDLQVQCKDLDESYQPVLASLDIKDAFLQGSGRIRHLSGKVLWVQSKVQCGEVSVSQVPTMFNLADVGTKPLSKKRLLALMGETGMVFVESQQPVGQDERAELQAHGATSRNMSKLAKTILRLTVMMGLEPTGANGQDGSCPVNNSNSDYNFWIGMTMFALVFSLLILGAAAFWFWRKLDKRLYWNELQLAETDDFVGKQRDQLVAVRTELETLSTRFEGHIQDFNEFVEQTSNETSLLEDHTKTIRRSY
eukprot:s491_g5.t1